MLHDTFRINIFRNEALHVHLMYNFVPLCFSKSVYAPTVTPLYMVQYDSTLYLCKYLHETEYKEVS